MCRILFKKNNDVKFDKRELEQSYQYNSDGTGLVYWDDKKQEMIVQKWLIGTPFHKIYNFVQKVEQLKSAKNIAIHFRFGTSGGKTIEQIHPIEISYNYFLLHNGIVREFEFDAQVMSDTQLMGFWLKCANIKVNSLKNKFLKKCLETKFVGNKLLLLESDKYAIINEELGEWVGGIWKSWKEYNYGKYKPIKRKQIEQQMYGWDSENWENEEIVRNIEPYTNQTTNKTQQELDEEELHEEELKKQLKLNGFEDTEI